MIYRHQMPISLEQASVELGKTETLILRRVVRQTLPQVSKIAESSESTLSS